VRLVGRSGSSRRSPICRRCRRSPPTCSSAATPRRSASSKPSTCTARPASAPLAPLQ
jgi:hypothetical protein